MHKLNYFIISMLALTFLFLVLPQSIFAQEDLDTAINNLADKINQHMAEKEKTKIAIIPFQNLTTDTVSTLGKYIAEELTTALFNSGKFQIIERNLLNKVLEELKLSQTGAVDPTSAKELGKITGVDAVVTGTVQDLINRVAVNCRLIETETGNIFAAASEKIRKDESISSLLEETVASSEIEAESRAKILRLKEGTYKVETTPRNISGYLFFGISNVEINKNNIVINFFVNHGVNNMISTFQLSEAYIIDSTSRRIDLIKATGLDPGTGGTRILGARVGGTSGNQGYHKVVRGTSRIWGSLYFPRVSLPAPDFLLYINGYEIEVKLVLPNK